MNRGSETNDNRASHGSSSGVVANWMTPGPVTIGCDDSIYRAAELMRDSAIGLLLVIDSEENLIGVLTDRDIVIRALLEEMDLKELQVKNIASRDVQTVAPLDPIERALALMRHRAVRRLPVVEEGRAVGIVSLGDISEIKNSGQALASISQAPTNH